MCGCHPTGKYYAGIAHLLKVQITGLVDGINHDDNWMDLPIAMIDVESTGFSPEHDRVIELGIVIAKHGIVKSKQRWLIDPEMHIPEASTVVHGIKDEDVVGKPKFRDVAPMAAAFMAGCIPAAFNADFDRRFIFAEFARAGIDSGIAEGTAWIDPLVWARHLYPKQKSRKLSEMALTCGVVAGAAHTAEADAAVAMEVMYAMGRDALKGVPKQYSVLVQEQRRLKMAQSDNQRFWRR